MRAHGHGVRHWLRAIPAAAAALAIWAGLGGTALLLADQRPAAAQSAEAVGRIAQAITVGIEGATQGSGVLVRREGNRYTVLTAWHVVADQKPGEELDIYAPDGNRYPVEQGSIKRLGEVDLAVLTFSSDRAYTIAITGEPRGLPLGSSLYVSGFPLGTSSVPLRLMRLLRGDLVGNGVVDASRSQYLLYSNPTLPGMSGGAVLNLRAELVGIHINAERADQISESTGKPVATGVNQGLAIGAYRKWVEATAGQPASSGARVITQQPSSTPPLPPRRLPLELRWPPLLLRQWQVNSGGPVVNSVAFSPDGRRIVSGSSDGTLRLWNANTGQLIGSPLRGHEEGLELSKVAFSPDGRRIVSLSFDGTLRLWDTKTGKPIGSPIRALSLRHAVAFSPDGQRIIESDQFVLRLWDARTGRPIGVPVRINPRGMGWGEAAFSPDRRRIVSSNTDYTLLLWDAGTGQLIGTPLRGHTNDVLSVAFSPDGRLIVSGSADGTLRLWDANTGKPIVSTMRGHQYAGLSDRVTSFGTLVGDSVSTVEFSPDGRHIVSASNNGSMRLWDARTGQPVGPLLVPKKSGSVTFAFSPDGRRIVSGSAYGTLQLWNLGSAAP